MTDPYNELYRWQLLAKEVQTKTVEEKGLRKKLFAHFFPSLKKGTSTQPLGQGYVLKGTASVNISVDQASLKPTLEAIPEQFRDGLFRWKPELSVSAFNKLPKEWRLIVEQTLVIKPGMPTLEVRDPVPTKEKAK